MSLTGTKRQRPRLELTVGIGGTPDMDGRAASIAPDARVAVNVSPILGFVGTMPCPEPRAGMRRRDFIKVIGSSVAAWPLAAHAQQAGKVHRVGFLWDGPDVFADAIEAFRGQRVENPLPFAASRPAVKAIVRRCVV